MRIEHTRNALQIVQKLTVWHSFLSRCEKKNQCKCVENEHEAIKMRQRENLKADNLTSFTFGMVSDLTCFVRSVCDFFDSELQPCTTRAHCALAKWPMCFEYDCCRQVAMWNAQDWRLAGQFRQWIACDSGATGSPGESNGSHISFEKHANDSAQRRTPRWTLESYEYSIVCCWLNTITVRSTHKEPTRIQMAFVYLPTDASDAVRTVLRFGEPKRQ